MTLDDEWVPFGIEEDDERVVEFLALHDDVPAWLDASLWTWILRRFVVGNMNQKSFRAALLQQASRALQRRMPEIEDWQYESGPTELRESYKNSPGRDVLALADFLIGHLDSYNRGSTELDNILAEGRSAWRVGERRGRPGLVRRLPKGVEDAVRHATELPNGGKKLAEAWNAAFGLETDPSRAYPLAIVAVEDAAIPVVCPKKVDAVLGDVIGELNANDKWKLPHQREHSEAPPREVLVSMMRMLNRGQHDRHGGAPLPLADMTQDEAESAVMLAATLVGWFSTGKITKS